jgi:hypothetical protein
VTAYVDQILTANDHNALDYRPLCRDLPIIHRNKVEIPDYPSWRKGAVCNSAAMEYARDHPLISQQIFISSPRFCSYSELNEAYRAYTNWFPRRIPMCSLFTSAAQGTDTVFGWDGFYPVAGRISTQSNNAQPFSGYRHEKLSESNTRRGSSG